MQVDINRRSQQRRIIFLMPFRSKMKKSNRLWISLRQFWNRGKNVRLQRSFRKQLRNAIVPERKQCFQSFDHLRRYVSNNRRPQLRLNVVPTMNGIRSKLPMRRMISLRARVFFLILILILWIRSKPMNKEKKENTSSDLWDFTHVQLFSSFVYEHSTDGTSRWCLILRKICRDIFIHSCSLSLLSLVFLFLVYHRECGEFLNERKECHSAGSVPLPPLGMCSL